MRVSSTVLIVVAVAVGLYALGAIYQAAVGTDDQPAIKTGLQAAAETDPRCFDPAHVGMIGAKG